MPAGPDEDATVSGEEQDRVAFDYIKGKDFRAIRADGAIGGITPSGYIHFALYSERPALPRRLVHQVAPDGTLGDPIPSECITRGSVVREMDVDVFLRPEVAERLHEWLGRQLVELRALVAQIDERELGEGQI